MNDFLIQLIVRSVVILLLAFVITALLRPASASSRYLVWAVALATIVALPVALIIVPQWKVKVEVPATVSSLSRPVTPTVDDVTPVAPTVLTNQKIEDAVANAAVAIKTSRPVPPEVGLVVLYLLGVTITLGRIGAGRYSLKRIARNAASLDAPEWQSLLRSEATRLDIDRPIRLMASERVSTPLATGILSPVILLPADARQWNKEHREVVIRHELAHIARNDALICLVAGIACAIYCFNPLVWIAARRLRTEQERSCDDKVITLGTNAADYAEHLLTVAKSARNIGMQSFVSVAMARPSQLEGRLLAVLHTRRRNPLTRRGAFAVSALAFLMLVTIAALRPVPAEAIVVASQAEVPASLRVMPAIVMASEVPIEKAKPASRFDSVVIADVAASSGGTLTLDLKTGAGVRITGTDENRVRMRAELGGRDWRGTEISLVGDGGDARITSRYRTDYGNTSSSHRITISVPHRYNVRIESSGGEIVLRDIEGSFTGTTGGGEIDIANASGRASLTTGGGEISVKNSRLSGSVGTGGGSVLIQGVTGGLRGSSGTGDVFYGGSGSSEGITYSGASTNGARRGSDGKTYLRKSGGSVNLGDVGDGASIHTGGGDITIGESRGSVEIGTGGGDITVGPLYNGGVLTTGAGNLRIEIAEAGGPLRASTGNGTVTLIVPRNLNADLELETAFTRKHGQTRIQSDIPLTTTVTDNWDTQGGTPRRYVRANQSIGSGGPTIRIKTVNGNIIVRQR